MSKYKVKTSIGWRVLSCRNDGGIIARDAGYWTSSYLNKEEAMHHADRVSGQCFEVTSRFLYKGNTLELFVGETWELLT